MYKRSSSFVFKIATFLTLFLMLGCAASPQQISSSNYNVETVKSDHLRLDHIDISKSENGITVKGDFHNIHGADRNRRPKGHIDVDIVGHKGKLFHKTQSNISRVSRFGKNNPLYERYKFKLEVPYLPVDGSTIRLSYHPAKNEANKNH